MKYRHKLWIDASSGFIATMLSSPFNFVRNMQYSAPKHEHHIPSMMNVLKELYRDGMNEGGIMKAMRFWLFRLRIGWGTARVAVGMSFTSYCFELTQQMLALSS